MASRSLTPQKISSKCTQESFKKSTEKIAKITEDLVRNKIVDKVTSVATSKPTSPSAPPETDEAPMAREYSIPPEKQQNDYLWAQIIEITIR